MTEWAYFVNKKSPFMIKMKSEFSVDVTMFKNEEDSKRYLLHACKKAAADAGVKLLEYIRFKKDESKSVTSIMASESIDERINLRSANFEPLRDYYFLELFAISPEEWVAFRTEMLNALRDSNVSEMVKNRIVTALKKIEANEK